MTLVLILSTTVMQHLFFIKQIFFIYLSTVPYQPLTLARQHFYTVEKHIYTFQLYQMKKKLG